MDIKSFYSSKELSAKIGQYLDSKDVAERFEKSAADLAANECLIPVLGTQGSGKSSFLNAILFGDIVLPVDADETTCIPTAVKYGDVASPEAYVVMSSGARQKVPCTERGWRIMSTRKRIRGTKKASRASKSSLRTSCSRTGSCLSTFRASAASRRRTRKRPRNI